MAAASIRESVVKARFYRLFAVLFAIGGLVMFLYLYLDRVEGHLFDALRDPFVVVIILVPFLPAVVLSWLAGKHERLLEKALDDHK